MSPNARKNAIYSVVLLILVVAVYLYRQNNQPAAEAVENRQVIEGKTMGTTYRVIYLDKEGRNFKPQIDSVLVVFNQSLSTYIPDSEISQFNKGTMFKFELPFFPEVLKTSREVYDATGGAFNPTVGPLVNAWGFGPDGPNLKDSIDVAELVKRVNFDSVFFDNTSVCKLMEGIYLDFSAIAKGYGVDVVATLLEKRGIQNFLIEIGGELVASGLNERGEIWKVGIFDPEGADAGERLEAIAMLKDRAIATSGNYRNFYIKDSVKYAHTISPFTGYPVEHSLLSASVFAPDCMRADAYATAFMVLGLEKSQEILAAHPELDAYLIYSDEQGQLQSFTTEGMKSYISKAQ